MKIAKYKFIALFLVPILALMTGGKAVLAWDEGVTVSSDFDNIYYEDAVDFSTTIDAYSGWSSYLLSHNPVPSWYQEESYGGIDDDRADYTELSLLVCHGASGQIAFPSGWIDDPDEVRLGYSSPDSEGYNIWQFFIVCNLFGNSYYSDWLSSLTGTHMLLGFSSTAVISNVDLDELAHRLTGTGGYSQQTIQDAYFATYVVDDGCHDDNICRILAENTSVADNDDIDTFTYQITVDSTKVIITCP